MTAVERLVATARAEVGYVEKKTNAQLDDKTANAGNADWNKYARDLDALGVVYNGKKNGYAWCDIFVDWCFIQTFGLENALTLLCQPRNGMGAGCTCSARYYKQQGRFHTKNPQPGDQIFFSKDGGETSYHTGLVVDVRDGKVYTVEGNTSSTPGVVPNGGMVRDKSYNLSYAKIGGYGRPDFSIIKEDEDVDIERFKELWTEVRKELQDNDAGEYSAEAREWAVANGLITGGDSAEFNGMWQDMLTREQFVTVLYRFAQLMGTA